MSLKGGFWREAATIILAVRCRSSPANYNVLMLKRSQRSKFFSETHVFPGGVISDADFDPRWSDLFRSVAKEDVLTPGRRFMERRSVPEMFRVERKDRSTLLPAQIAFRICAIRETFEESGVLLVTKEAGSGATLATMSGTTLATKSGVTLAKDEAISGATIAKETAESGATLAKAETKYTLDLSDWRRRVNKDPSQFLTLCQSLRMVPNIWALYEWCNWLTPVLQPLPTPPERPRRFDTMFYICCLDEQPEARVDRRETTVAQWGSPGDLLNDPEAKIRGPQLYELAKLESVVGIEQLAEFAASREGNGVQRWMPVVQICPDGILLTLPGDHLYPDDPDFEGTRGYAPNHHRSTLDGPRDADHDGTRGHIQHEASIATLDKNANQFNRMWGNEIPPKQLHVMYEPKLGYLTPPSERNSLPGKITNSKL